MFNCHSDKSNDGHESFMINDVQNGRFSFHQLQHKNNGCQKRFINMRVFTDPFTIRLIATSLCAVLVFGSVSRPPAAAFSFAFSFSFSFSFSCSCSCSFSISFSISFSVSFSSSSFSFPSSSSPSSSSSWLNPHLRQWVWLTCGSEIFRSLAAVRLHHLRQWNSYQTLKADHLRQWDFGTFVLLLGWGGVGWGGIITFMFQYTQAREQAVVFHHQLLLGWGGVGWDNNVHVPVHTQARQQAVVFHHQLLLGWGGVG